MREIWFGLLLLLVFGGVPPAAAQAPQTADPATIQRLLQPAEQDRILGKPEAKLTIIEYASFTCPHCARFAAEVLPKLKEKWIDTGKAKLVMRPFPRDEADLRAAMVVQCGPPERYYPLADTLFETQEKWVVDKDWRAALRRTVLVAGIGKKEFDACLIDKAHEDQLLQSRLDSSTKLGVGSTPTFFVNGKKYDGEPTFEAFDKLLSELAGNS